MTEKQYTAYYQNGKIVSVHTPNGDLINIEQMIDKLNEQHETIKALEFLADEHKRQKNEIVKKVQETLQKHYNKYSHGTFTADSMQIAIKLICDELGVEL